MIRLMTVILAVTTICVTALPGFEYTTTWAGNTYNGGDHWVQQTISGAAVAADGRVFTISGWDEARREAGIYHHGQAVGALTDKVIKHGNSSGQTEIAVDGAYVYALSERNIHRFDRDGRSTNWSLSLGFQASGLAAGNGRLVASDRAGNRVVVYDLQQRTVLKVHALQAPGDVCLGANGRIWVVAGSAVVAIDQTSGVELARITGESGWQPARLAVHPNGQLMVADNGHGLVRFFAVDGTPRQVKTFGQRGGLLAGIPGEIKPDKLWGMTGIGCDAAGNFYITMSTGGSVIRSFTYDGTQRWELLSRAWSECGDWDTRSGGQLLFCNDDVFAFDWTKEGGAWRWLASTVDPKSNDIRVNERDYSTALRWINNRRVLFSTNMKNTRGIHTFLGDETGWIFRPAGHHDISRPDWCIGAGGDIWHINRNTLYRRPFTGISANGQLQYGKDIAHAFPNNPFNKIGKIEYDEARDIMYIAGGTPQHEMVGSAQAGPVVMRFNNWSTAPREAWRITIPFNNNEATPRTQRMLPNTMDFAGPYVFVGYQNYDAPASQYQFAQSGVIHVYAAATGKMIGRLLAQKGTGSWIDILRVGIRASVRSDGAVLVAREENWKSKQIVFVIPPHQVAADGGKPVSNVAPTISGQPQSRSVTVGQTATFNVTASGTPTPSYRWQKNGITISGATSASYTTPATTLADHGATYRVIVSNSAGSVTSSSASLTVTSITIAPTISAQPQPRSVTVGQTATFNVTASGTPTPSYQWQKNGSTISGATSASYTTPVATLADHGAVYRVVVSNSAGSVTSSNAGLTVTPAAEEPPPVDEPFAAIAINFQPASASTPSGWLADTSAVFGNRGNGVSYGWTSSFNETRDRNAANAPDQLHDTLNHMQKDNVARIWELAVPSGTYAVRVLRGDPSFTDQINHLLVEGQRLADRDGFDSFDDDTVIVTVTDGRLTVAPAADAINAKICAIEIRSAAIAGDLPAGWSTQTIGNANPVGSTTFDGSTWTLRGAGADIWHASDGFRYAWQPISGDFDAVVRVTGLTTTHVWAKAGLMLRENTAADSRHISCFITPGNGTSMQWRTSTGSNSGSLPGPKVTVPTWLKLERRGNTVTTLQSGDGTTWHSIGSRSISIPANALLGLAVTSHVDGTLTTATFIDVEVLPVGSN